MAESIRASVIVTTYNVDKTIKDTLECIFNADVNFEMDVIVVDDASTDSTPEICQSYNVEFIGLNENRGPAHARNVAINAASGEYLVFIDSDVKFPPDLLQRMMDRLVSEPALGGVGSVSDPEPLNPNFFSRYFAIQEYFLITSSAAINRPLGICTRCGILKRRLFEEFGGFDERHRKPSIEDYQFSLRIRDSYDIRWDPTFINQHYFPDKFWKIMKRLHRNTREMIQIMDDLDVKDTGPFVNDTRARILIILSGLFALTGFIQPLLLTVAVILMASAVALKKPLLTLFYRKHGPVFALKGWFLYMLICMPLLTGTLAGLIQLKRHKRKEHL